MARATDDERREVAENLRTMCAYGVRYKEQFYDLLEETVMDVEDFHEFSDVAERLADLIEPSRDASATNTDASATHTDVDREALLALAGGLEADADRIIKAAKNARFGVGPRMSEAKLDAAEWRSIARRIREALGDCQRGVSGAGDRGAPRGLSGQVGGRAQGSTRADRDEKE